MFLLLFVVRVLFVFSLNNEFLCCFMSVLSAFVLKTTILDDKDTFLIWKNV